MKFKPVNPDLISDDPREFVSRTEEEFQRVSDNKRTMLNLQSGGVDSTATGLLGYRALGNKFRGIHLETGFMRDGECKEVLWDLNSKCNLPVIYRDLSEDFLTSVINAGKNAEKKREAFSETYFRVALNLAKEFDAEILGQGTIKPDWIESNAGIKRQHNVVTDRWMKRYEEKGIIIAEPLYHLFKPQVRGILRWFGVNEELAKRQPLPGPGLSVRLPGQVTKDKVKTLKKLDSIVTPELESSMEVYRSQGKDVQYFAALMDAKTEKIEISSEYAGIKISNPMVAEDRVTGMVEGKRTYKKLLLFNSKPEYPIPIEQFSKASREIIEKNEDIGRCAVVLRENDKGDYIGLIRAITTKDFTKAEAAEPPASFVHVTAGRVMNAIPQIRILAYDITDKPPSTIEYE